MKRFKINDWQEIALKKDTEAILRKLNTQEPVFFSLCWEIVIAIAAVIIDHLFDTESVSIHVWIFCVVLAVVPPLIILGIKFSEWLAAIGRAKAGKYNVRRFVDLFDNQICYWVMMSNSYSRILSDLENGRQSEMIFLYQEGSYYNNKSIQALYSMKPVIDKVFSGDSDSVIKNKNVSVYRLLNIIEMINQQQNALDNSISNMRSNDLIAEQLRINASVQRDIIPLIEDMNAIFGTGFKWNIAE